MIVVGDAGRIAYGAVPVGGIVATCQELGLLKQHLIDHFNRKRYYEYHSGYRPVPPEHEQYIRQAILRYGWTEPVEFNAYVEDYLW